MTIPLFQSMANPYMAECSEKGLRLTGSMELSKVLTNARHNYKDELDITPLTHEESALCIPELIFKHSEYRADPGVDNYPCSVLVKWAQIMGWEFVAPLHFMLCRDTADITWEWICVNSARTDTASCPDLHIEDHDWLFTVFRQDVELWIKTWDLYGPEGVSKLAHKILLAESVAKPGSLRTDDFEKSWDKAWDL